MSLARLIGGIVVILVLFAIISNPAGSASSTRNGAGAVGNAGNQVVVFLSTLVGNLSDGVGPTNATQVYHVPRGGVATGDGSTEPAG